MKNAYNYQNVNRGRLVAAWIWNVVSARPDGLERGRKTSVNPAALYRRAADLGLDSGFINRTARCYFPDLDLRDAVWKIPRQPEFRLFEKEADGDLGRAFRRLSRRFSPFAIHASREVGRQTSDVVNIVLADSYEKRESPQKSPF